MDSQEGAIYSQEPTDEMSEYEPSEAEEEEENHYYQAAPQPPMPALGSYRAPPPAHPNPPPPPPPPPPPAAEPMWQGDDDDLPTIPGGIPKTDWAAAEIVWTACRSHFKSVGGNLWVWHPSDGLWRYENCRMRLIYNDLKEQLGPKYGENVGHQDRITTMIRSHCAEPLEWTMQLNQTLKPGELAFSDCIFNVLTFERRPLTPADMLTDKMQYRAPGRGVDPNALADVKRILADIFPMEEERTRLMKYYAESLLCGKSIEKYMVQIVGQGDNGKTTLNKILFECFPQYVGFTSVDNLLKQERGSNKHADWLTDNKAKRILGVEEPPHGAKLDGALLKEVTGNGVQTARGIYGKPFSFYVNFRIYIMTNSPVLIPNAGVAEIRRLQTFRAPCEFVATPDPSNPLSKPRDATLLTKFTGKNYKVAMLYVMAEYFRTYLADGFSVAPEESNYLAAEIFDLPGEVWKLCDYGDAKADCIAVKDLYEVLTRAGYNGSKTSLFEDLRNLFARDRRVKCLTTDRNYRVRGLRFRSSVFESQVFRQFEQ